MWEEFLHVSSYQLCFLGFLHNFNVKLSGVHVVVENLEKSWNFSKMVISSPEKVMEINIKWQKFGKSHEVKNISETPPPKTLILSFRVCTIMENLEKSWNFNIVISRPGKFLKKINPNIHIHVFYIHKFIYAEFEIMNLFFKRKTLKI